MTTPGPARIRVDLPANRLHIAWADGKDCTYPGGYLRFICPCAACRGHGPGQVPPPAWEDVKDARITNVEAVGAYALRVTTDDGHATGIYSYDLLYQRCEEAGTEAGGEV